MGWDSSDKQKELFHHDSRFIVLSTAVATDVGNLEADMVNTIIGYSMFRFDYDEGEKLLYW